MGKDIECLVCKKTFKADSVYLRWVGVCKECIGKIKGYDPYWMKIQYLDEVENERSDKNLADKKKVKQYNNGKRKRKLIKKNRS